MVGWHHRFDEHEFEWAPGVGDGQEAWHASVHGVAKVRHDWVTELRSKRLSKVKHEDHQQYIFKKKKNCIQDLWGTIKQPKMHVIGVKEERGKVEEILEKAIDDNFPKLMKENKPCFHESETTSSKLNKCTKNGNIKVKLLKSCQRRLRGWGHYIQRSKDKNKRKILI